jgi:crossover junction endodeoxyribonuclease RusA
MSFHVSAVTTDAFQIVATPGGKPITATGTAAVTAIQLTLPYPISANRYWRTFMPKGFKAPVTTVSQEAKSYKSQVAFICKTLGIKQPISGRVAIDIKLYPKRPQDWAKRALKNPDQWG